MSAALKQFREDVESILKEPETSQQDKTFQVLGALSEYKRSLPHDYVEAEMVWVLTTKDPEGYSVYGVFGTYEKADIAKTKIAAKTHTSLNEFEITEIAFDAGHPWGILSQDDSFDVQSFNQKETEKGASICP